MVDQLAAQVVVNVRRRHGGLNPALRSGWHNSCRRLVPPPFARLCRIEATENHCQLCRSDEHAGVAGRGKGKGAAFQPPEVDSEPVSHSGQDLELVPAPVLEDEQVAPSGLSKRTDRTAPASESIPLRPSTGSTATRMRPPGRRVNMTPLPRRHGVGGCGQRETYQNTRRQHDRDHRVGDDPDWDERERLRLGRLGAMPFS